MTEETKKIVLPAYLLRRLEAFRIVKNGEPSYLLRDKVQGKTYDFDPWQFFILEVLPGSDSLERLQASFLDRFDRDLSKQDFEELMASVADRKLFEETAATHPLLARYMHLTYHVEDGKATPKPFSTSTGAAPTLETTAAPPKPAAPGVDPAAAATAKDRDADLPAGVQDALGMDWRTTENMIEFFDPRPALKLLAPVLRPLRYIAYVVPLLLLIALVLMYQYFGLLTADLALIRPEISLFQHLLFVFLTVHVVTTLTAAVVAHSYMVSVDKVGIALTLGFMPRWVLKMTGADRLTRIQTMWLHGATLIARMVMFSVGALVWYNARDSQGDLSTVGLLFMFSCGIGLVAESGNPLIKANGYYLLSAYLNEPHLRARAYVALLNKMRGGVYKAADSTLLVLYAMLSTTYVVIIILVAGLMLARYVLGGLALGGSAIIISLAFVGYMLWRNYVGLKKFGETYERQLQFDRWRSRTLPVDAVEGEVSGTRQTSYWKIALLVCLVLLLFLPYPYQPGGQFTIFPVRKQIISTDTPGLIEAVYFEGGESVKEGTVLARLSHEDYLAQIKVLSAKIDEQRSVIDNLKTLPKPEEVKLAVRELELQRAREVFSRDKEPRLEKLQVVGAVSFEEYDTARKDHINDVQMVAQKEAALALVKAPVTADQIAAAEAKLVSLQEERATYAAKVERTTLKMPFDGNILTLHLKDKINSYLDKGAPFASLEYTGLVTAQVEVAESDIHFVKVGSTIRARAVSYFDDREFTGKVTLIDRNVTVKSTGNVILVIATIDNHDGLLKTGMAGQAKVDAVDMPVWKAFTLGIYRFIQIQMWSWLP